MNLEGCQDNGCLIKKPEGQGTNGGCRCINKNMTTKQILEVKAFIYIQQNRIKELEFKLDGANGALKETLKANKQVDQALAKLRDNQHSLDPEAQRILNENFWDLVGD